MPTYGRIYADTKGRLKYVQMFTHPNELTHKHAHMQTHTYMHAQATTFHPCMPSMLGAPARVHGNMDTSSHPIETECHQDAFKSI